MSDQQLRHWERIFQQDPTSENARNYMASLARSNAGSEVDYAAWLRYLSGHWTLTPPTQEGSYTIATREGDISLPRVLIFKHPETGELRAMRFTRHARGRDATDVWGGCWGGYWWSEPVPELPCVPKEAEKLVE